MSRSTRTHGWAAWSLILAAAVPDVLIIRFGWKILTGSADDSWNLGERVLTGPELLGNRWTIFWSIPSVPIMPLMALLPLIVLVVLATLDRTKGSRMPVPTTTARIAAAAVAAVTAVLGLTGTVAACAQVLGWLPALGWGSYTGSQLEVSAPMGAVVFTTTVVAAVATVILWPHRHPQLSTSAAAGNADAVDEASQEEPATEASEDTTAPQFASDEGAADRASQPPAPAPAPPTLPAPSAADLDLYRRR